MIISRQKPLDLIIKLLAESRMVFLVGCAKCATVCKSGGEEEVWQMQEQLTSAGKEITGTLIIDEACHLLRAQRDLRGKDKQVQQAEAILVLACGAGIQSVASFGKKTISGTDTLFLGTIRRFGQFEQRCSLCGSCRITETGSICPVTLCPKGLANGPCGGMDNGRCEVSQELECAWALIYERLSSMDLVNSLEDIAPPADHGKVARPAKFNVEK
jgi:ferredoxin